MAYLKHWSVCSRCIAIGAALMAALPTTSTLAGHSPWDIFGHSGWSVDSGDDRDERCSPPCDDCNGTGSPVAVRSGALILNFVDLEYQVGEIPLQIKRFYNSDTWHGGQLGKGWTSVLNQFVLERKREGQPDVTEAAIRWENGQEFIFASDESDFVRGPDGIHMKYSFSQHEISLKNGTRYRYDSNRNLSSIVDRNGNSIAFFYDVPAGRKRLGRLTRIGLPNNRDIHLTYGPSGRLRSISDFAGRAVFYEYDEQGALTQVTDAMGASWRYVYESSRRTMLLTEIIDPLGQEILHVAYDARARVTSTIDAEGSYNYTYLSYTQKRSTAPDAARWRYTFDSTNGVIKSILDPYNHTTSLTFNATSDLQRIADRNGAATTFTHDDRGNILSFTNAENETTHLTYDSAHGRVETITHNINSEDIMSRYAYDPLNGNLLWERHAEGWPEQMEVRYDQYDARGNPTRIIDPRGNALSFTYDANSHLSSLTDRENHVWQMAHDDLGNLLSFEGPLANRWTFQYDNLNRLTRETDPLGFFIEYEFDAAGHLTLIRDQRGHSWEMRYDKYGRLTELIEPPPAATEPRPTTRFAYDSYGRMIQLTDANGEIIFLQRDKLGRLVKTIEKIGDTNPAADADDIVTTYAYDRERNLKTQINPDGSTYLFDYDGAERLTSITTGLGTVTYVYDGRGRITGASDWAGRPWTYVYNRLGDLIQATGPDVRLDYTYDANGFLQSAVSNDPPNTINFTYDNEQRLTNVTTSLPAAAVDYVYDHAGRLTSRNGSGTGLTQYQYDARGLIERITNAHNRSVSLSYDPSGRRTSIVRPNGVNTAFTYDDAGRLTTINHTGLSPTALALAYTHDSVGNILTATDGDGEHSYTYDDRGQLLAATHPPASGIPNETYTYDKMRNRITSHLSSQYVYDGLNRLLEDDTHTYEYDVNHNLTKRTHKTSNAQMNLAFDGRDQLRSVTMPDGTVAEYDYDALGRRVEKRVNGTVTRYAYDGEDILHVENAVGTITTEFLHGPGIDDVLEVAESGGVFYYLRDHLGSPRALSDLAGTQTAQWNRDSFGRMFQETGTAHGSYDFTGRERDSETGLLYYRARYYDSNTGRFASLDPLGLGLEGQSFYPYVANNSVNWRDPSGLIPVWDIIDIGFFADSVYQFSKCPGVGTGFSLVADTISLLPIIPSIGWITRADDIADLARTGGRLADAGRASKPIVIGENMKRVQQHADDIGGHAYRPWNNAPFDSDLAMRRNDRWIKDQMRQGREIIDIGPDFQRRAATGRRSSFYEMERRRLRESGYQNYSKGFQRSGSKGGVSGLDH